MHGKLRVTYSSGDIFEGEFKRGYQTGFGKKSFLRSQEKYVGMWSNGQITGYGQYYITYPVLKMYAGHFYNAELYGFGQIKTEKYTYRGMVKNC